MCGQFAVKNREQTTEVSSITASPVRKHVRDIIPSELDFIAYERREARRLFVRVYVWFFHIFNGQRLNKTGHVNPKLFEMDRFDPKSIMVQRSINY